MNEKRKMNLGEGDVKKLLISLAIPAITAQIINVLYNLVDRIYIARIPDVGSLAFTGVGICMPLIALISAFSSLAAVGSSARATIMMGRNDKPAAERILGNAVTMLTLFAIMLTAGVLIWGKDLLMLFGASTETIVYSWDYMSIYSIGTISVMFALGLNTFIACQGKTVISMVSTLIGAILNIILDPIFIFGFGLGVKGAAYATIISQTASAIWVLSFLLGKNTLLRIKIKNLIPSFKVMLPCLALGLSPFIMQSTEGIINICFNTSLFKYGGDSAVATMTILTTLMQFSMLPLIGLTQGAQPIMSYNYGAGNSDRCKKTFKILLKACLTYSVVFAGLVLIFPQYVAMLIIPDKAVIANSILPMRVFFIGTIIFGIQVACQQTFIAIGNAKTSVFLAILRKIILLVPLIYILPLFMENKVMAVFMAEPISDIISVIVAGSVFFFSFRKAMKALDDKQLLINKK